MYTSDNSNIDDSRLLVGDEEVTYTVVNSDAVEIYSMPTDAYATSYESQITQERAKH